MSSDPNIIGILFRHTGEESTSKIEFHPHTHSRRTGGIGGSFALTSSASTARHTVVLARDLFRSAGTLPTCQLPWLGVHGRRLQLQSCQRGAASLCAHLFHAASCVKHEQPSPLATPLCRTVEQISRHHLVPGGCKTRRKTLVVDGVFLHDGHECRVVPQQNVTGQHV